MHFFYLIRDYGENASRSIHRWPKEVCLPANLKFHKGKHSKYQLRELLLLHWLREKLALLTQTDSSSIQQKSGYFWSKKQFQKGLFRKRGIWKNQAQGMCRRYSIFLFRDALLCAICSCSCSHAGTSESQTICLSYYTRVLKVLDPKREDMVQSVQNPDDLNDLLMVDTAILEGMQQRAV